MVLILTVSGRGCCSALARLLIFIIFNATVVFGDGMVRWVGLAICLLLTLTWLYGQSITFRLLTSQVL